MKVVDRFTRWLRETDERRRSARHGEPDLVAYGGLLASPCEICNISSTGIHVRTPERWYPGTRIQLTLDRKQLDKHIHGPESIRVYCDVVWSDRDGVGLRFVSPGDHDHKTLTLFIADVIATLNRRKLAMQQVEDSLVAVIHARSDSRDLTQNRCTDNRGSAFQQMRECDPGVHRLDF
jgi:PilZ domain-containing protein